MPARKAPAKKAARTLTRKNKVAEVPPERIGLEYLNARHLSESASKQMNDWKKRLMDHLETRKADGKGNRFFNFPEPVKFGEQEVRGFKRERRVSQVMDEDKALALIKKKKLEDRCLKTITVIDEDALLAVNFEDDKLISDKELNDIYSNNETFALILVKE